MKQKVIKIGTSIGVTIPKDVAKELHIKAGDEVSFVLHEGTGTISYTPMKTVNRAEEVSEWTDGFIKKYKKALDALKDK